MFTSSIAVFGAPFPDKIGDEFFTTPLTSYGTQKAIGELLLADYSRRGFFDGIGIRLPTICIRPGSRTRRRRASSPTSCASRSSARRRCCRSPRTCGTGTPPRARPSASSFARDDGPRRLGWRRGLTMPGLSATVGEQIAALTRVAGAKAAALIRREPDPTIVAIVAGWPRDFDAEPGARARLQRAETSFDEIIRAHIEDELGRSTGGGS